MSGNTYLQWKPSFSKVWDSVVRVSLFFFGGCVHQFLGDVSGQCKNRAGKLLSLHIPVACTQLINVLVVLLH